MSDADARYNTLKSVRANHRGYITKKHNNIPNFHNYEMKALGIILNALIHKCKPLDDLDKEI